MDARTPVVVVYRGGNGALAVARTLGRLGVPVTLVAHEGLATPIAHSRYWRERLVWDFEQPEEESVEYLLAVGGRLERTHGGRPLLLTLADWVAIFIERHADALAAAFRFPHAAEPVIRRLANKAELAAIAGELRIPTPDTVAPRTRAEVDAFVERMPFPIVLKPADAFLPDAPRKLIAQTRAELDRELARLEPLGPYNFVLQEHIPGGVDDVWMCNAYFGNDSRCVAVFTGRKLRQVSPTGVASLAECVPNGDVAGQTTSLLQAVGYRGCVGVGYRYDARDGRYKVLDVNPRVSGVFRLFAGTNDLDVVRICYLDLTNQPVGETHLQPGRRWLLEEDVIAAVRAVRAGDLSLRDWALSLRGVRESHWFAADDPLPALALLRGAVVSRARALGR